MTYPRLDGTDGSAVNSAAGISNVARFAAPKMNGEKKTVAGKRDFKRRESV